MSFLLKIVQGPNAGAEIALVEGVNLTFGCADDCDIILSDSSVGEKAFELEVTSERVVAVMPDGKTMKLEPYKVTFVGASALVVGPSEGIWKSLVWPKMEVAAEDIAETQEDDKVKVQEEKPTKKVFSWRGIILVVITLLLCGLAVFAWKKYPQQTKQYSLKALSATNKAWGILKEKFSKEKPDIEMPVAESLDEVANDCGFKVVRNGDEVIATGDFLTRIKRLEATARAYASHPGLKVDFTDAESISCAVSELMELVCDGVLKLDKLEGRKAYLSGCVSSRNFLEKVLRSLSEDVPKITSVDCSKVTITSLAEVAAAGDGKTQEAGTNVLRCAKKQGGSKAPQMPIAGILTIPYPCLVLNDGTRIMEGARFGAYTIEKILPDRITVRSVDGSFEWRP